MSLPVIAVIMAGGSGERFWPLSRQKHPKQLLNLTHESKSMLEEAVDRLLPLVPAERIFIATNQLLQEAVQQQFTVIPKENVLGEPARRNTTGCLVWAAAHAMARLGGSSEDLKMAVTTADHRIGNDERFRQVIGAALSAAETPGVISTVGIAPTRPETGYGYIEVEPGVKASIHDTIQVFPVEQFREKPDEETARQYIKTGRFYWNSGMFFWRLSSFIDGLNIAQPEITQTLNTIAQAIRNGAPDEELRTHFETLPNLSIDYALMEHAKNVQVALGDFPWDDVGAWDALSRGDEIEGETIAVGDPVLLDCENVTVYNQPGADNMAVGVLGMKNVIVVTSPDGVLVCPKDRAQDVKKIVAELKERDARQL